MGWGGVFVCMYEDLGIDRGEWTMDSLLHVSIVLAVRVDGLDRCGAHADEGE
jgi:hypothetical protein